MAEADFRAWLAMEAGIGAVDPAPPKQVRRSVTHSSGESDVEMTVRLTDGRLARLLIENKVDAALQTKQAERYLERAEAYTRGGECAIARTILIAPAAYFGDSEDALGFDACISYEDIRNRLIATMGSTPRADYKKALLTMALAKATTGYSGEADREMTLLWERYRALVNEHAPELNMPDPKGRPPGSTFVFFKPDELPRGLLLVHKFRHGHVDIEFKGWGSRIGELRTQLQPVIPDGTSLVQASKSVALRRLVEPVTVTLSEDEQTRRLLSAIDAVRCLWRWWADHPELATVIESLRSLARLPADERSTLG